MTADSTPTVPDDDARCAGAYTVRGPLVGLCMTCERTAPASGPRTVHVEPMAMRSPSGVWVCPDYRAAA